MTSLRTSQTRFGPKEVAKYPCRERWQIFVDGKRLPFGRAKPKL